MALLDSEINRLPTACGLVYLKTAALRMVTFLLTPSSNCITSVEDIGPQPTPLSGSLYGIQGLYSMTL